jgi:phosphatidylglycerol---prolipoprotein diacylglyceryl transferase
MELTKKKIILTSLILLGLMYFLSLVFKGQIVLPQTFNLLFLNFHFYGLVMFLAVFSAWILARKNAQKLAIETRVVDDIVFWVVVGGFVGARLYHVLSSVSYYLHYPLEILKVYNGGLSIYGAVLGGVISLYFCKKFLPPQFSFLSLLDWLVPSLLIGQIIGRFGNFFNYELYGYPTNLPWKMFVPEQFRLLGYENFKYFHPLFLYEALINLAILFFLSKYKKNLPAGNLFFYYVLLYNIGRLLLEFLRIDSVLIGQIRQNALFSLVLIVVSAFCLFKYKYGKIS